MIKLVEVPQVQQTVQRPVPQTHLQAQPLNKTIINTSKLYYFLWVTPEQVGVVEEGVEDLPEKY